MSLKLGLRNKIRRSRAGGFTGLLDQSFATGAKAAYSLRRLKSSATKAVRVREDSGNTETDIGFSGALLDETALLNHVGSNNGFVTKWYDQSGNGNDASNSTASEQPQIVSSGSVIKENSKPAIQFDGNDDFLDVGVSITIDSFFNVLKSNANNGGSGEYNNKRGFLFSDKSTYTPFILFGSGSSNLTKETFFIADGSDKLGTDSTKVIQSQILLSTLTTDSKIFADGVAVNLIATGAVPKQFNLQIGTRQSGDIPFDGTMQEIIIYNSDKASNRNGIEANINNHYSIF